MKAPRHIVIAAWLDEAHGTAIDFTPEDLSAFLMSEGYLPLNRCEIASLPDRERWLECIMTIRRESTIH